MHKLSQQSSRISRSVPSSERGALLAGGFVFRRRRSVYPRFELGVGLLVALLTSVLLLVTLVFAVNDTENGILGDSSTPGAPNQTPYPEQGVGSIPTSKSGWLNDQSVEGGTRNASSPSIVSGPGGMLHVAWQEDSDGAGNWDIMYSSSSDGGVAWSSPVVVAGSPDPETEPEIAVRPDDSNFRIFVVYVRNITGGFGSAVYVSYSDDGDIWNSIYVTGAVFVIPYKYQHPEIVVEYAHDRALDPSYRVYVTFERTVFSGRSVVVYGSLDSGSSYTLLNMTDASAGINYGYPTLTYRRGPPSGTGGGTNITTPGPRTYELFLAYLKGDASTMTDVAIKSSDDYGGTWSAPSAVRTGGSGLQSTTIASSRDGDSYVVAWQEDGLADTRIGYALTSDGTWTPEAHDTAGVNDLGPVLAVDGDGTSNDGIGGGFHLVWTRGSPDDFAVIYSSIPTDPGTWGEGWTQHKVVSDQSAKASSDFPAKGLTTQPRGEVWHPSLVWSDFRNSDFLNLVPSYDVNFVTKGSRVTVETMPLGLTYEVDDKPFSSPRTFDWAAGLNHNLGVTALQEGEPGVRHLYDHWSDSGARTHSVSADTTDRAYTAHFSTEYNVTVDTIPTGLQVEVNGSAHTAPVSFWWEEGENHIDVRSLQNVESGIRYAFVSWSDGFSEGHLINVAQPETFVAEFVKQYLVTIETSAAILEIQVDETWFTNSMDFWWNDSSKHSLGTESPQPVSTDTRYSFVRWSDGGAQNHFITVTKPDTIVAEFAKEYRVTFDTTPTGLDVRVEDKWFRAPEDFWWEDGSVISIDTLSIQPGATGVQYAFRTWSDGGAQSHSVTVTAPITLVAQFATEYRVRIDTNPSGLEIMVNDTSFSSPAEFWWEDGSVHSIDTLTTQPGATGVRYAFRSWSDGGAQSHQISVTMPGVITGHFVTEYLVILDTVPGGLEIQVDGDLYVASEPFYWEEGSVHQVRVPSPQHVETGIRYVWDSWTDGGAQSHEISVVAPGVIVSRFTTEYLVNIQTAPSGLNVVVNGMSIKAPITFWWRSESTQQLNAPSPQPEDPAARYTWKGWSDGGEQSHAITISAPTTILAEFTTEYLVTIDTVPSGLEVVVDGVTYRTPVSFWWDVSRSHTIAVKNAQGGQVFLAWSDGGDINHDIEVVGPTRFEAIYTSGALMSYFLPWIVGPAAFIVVNVVLIEVIRRRRVRPEGSS